MKQVGVLAVPFSERKRMPKSTAVPLSESS